MRVISLNIWAGRVFEPLKAFVRAHRATTDFFCFQEVLHHGTDKTNFDPTRARNEIFSEIQHELPDFAGCFAPAQDGEWGLACFVRKGMTVSQTGDVFIRLYKDSMIDKNELLIPNNLQYCIFEHEGQTYTLAHVHGMWAGKGVGKGDLPERIAQSRRIIDFLQTKAKGRVVLCGDFNLWPETESLKMIEDCGMRNLIKEKGITSTRSSYYKSENKFADYVLVSGDVLVKHFEVLQDEVSDHLPLLVDFA